MVLSHLHLIQQLLSEIRRDHQIHRVILHYHKTVQLLQQATQLDLLTQLDQQATLQPPQMQRLLLRTLHQATKLKVPHRLEIHLPPQIRLNQATRLQIPRLHQLQSKSKRLMRLEWASQMHQATTLQCLRFKILSHQRTQSPRTEWLFHCRSPLPRSKSLVPRALLW